MRGREHLKLFPQPLLGELTRGRWLPIVGAGFSKNAVVPGGPLPPDWRELGRAMARDVRDHEYESPIEAISSYEQAFGRVALVQAISSSLRIHDATPGAAHLAFARLGFERVVTTNFDLLLERAYDAVGRPCLPLVEEVQLSGENPYVGPTLLKLHGDVHHPERMVMTEDDYDGFLRRHPLLVTHLAAHLIDHTAVLIGYSLEDPDMRQILSLLKDRLGPLARPLWTLQIDAPAHVISRFERRGVRVVNLKKRRNETYDDVLTALFEELREYWQREVIEDSQSTEERTLADLRLPAESSNTCYFAVPLDLLPWYRDTVFPAVEQLGLVPVVARDVLTPDGTLAVKIDALIGRARAVVIELASPNSYYEAGLALSMEGANPVLLIRGEKSPLPTPFQDRFTLTRPNDLTNAAEPFVDAFSQWLATVTETRPRQDLDEADRLLALGETRAAVVAAVSQLEWQLAARVDGQRGARRPVGLSRLWREAVNQGLVDEREYPPVAVALTLRNEALHLGRPISDKEARQAVNAIKTVIRLFDR